MLLETPGSHAAGTRALSGGLAPAAAAAAAAAATAATAPPPPPPGSLLDITPRQCATNLPLSDEVVTPDMLLPPVETEAEAEAEAEAELSPRADGGGSGGSDKDEIAHGSSFVGRHLEMHAVIHAVLR